MSHGFTGDKLDRFITDLGRFWMDGQDRLVIAKAIRALDPLYDLERKMAKEPGVGDVIKQMVGRLANSYPILSAIQNKRILDIACGSNTSKLPASGHVRTLSGETSYGLPGKGYTALFEPWFCRILLELGATPVGVDFGDLEQEAFIHYPVDLGKKGALDFLPDHSFDGIQDSRLFGSPEFTAQFPDQADRLKVAQEIRRQEQRLLKVDGILIHSDAIQLVK